MDGQAYAYFHDYENRVVKIKDSSNNAVGGYVDHDLGAEVGKHMGRMPTPLAYDALGRRIEVVDSKAGTATLCYYNPDWQVPAEYDDANSLQRYFVYGNYIDEPLVMHRQSDGEDYYYGQDHLYSTVVLLDDGGSVVERYEYDAYGTAHIMV